MVSKTMRLAGRASSVLSVLAMLALLLPSQGIGAGRPADDKKKEETARLRIAVTAGEDNRPVDGASVYLKFPKDRKSQEGKQVELNLKTNLEGVTQSPEIPQRKILIQIIAPGWKTFGEWFDINKPEQTISIHLVRPPKWY